jgi:hypothetical protein
MTLNLTRKPTKYKVKTLAANLDGSANQNVYIDTVGATSDFKFTLEVGKTYRITLCPWLFDNTGSSQGRVDIKDNTTTIVSFSGGRGEDSLLSSTQASISIIHTMSSTSLRFYFYSKYADANIKLYGDNSLNATYAMVEELQDYEDAGTDWD